MTSYKVSIKWGKEKFDDVSLDTAQSPLDFKVQLYSLTGVPPERQKVMVKGGMLKDDSTWDKLDLKDGFTFMLMGTAEALPQAPVQETKFVEDMTEQELNKAREIPAGLENLGNTCYMNSTLQVLRGIPELSNALSGYQAENSMNWQTDPSNVLTTTLRDTFTQLMASGTAISPFIFLEILRLVHPQFAQQQQGRYSQQDAEECWSQIVTALSQKLKTNNGLAFIQQYFGLQMTSTWKCNESDEAETVTTENLSELKCHITKDVGLLYNGILEGLKDDVEKHSLVLNRTAIYSKTSRLTRIPSYLTVNFVRFFWRRDTQKKAKVLKKVTYPLIFDAYDFCSDDLKKKLDPTRARFKVYDDSVAEKKAKEKRKAAVISNDSSAMDVTPAGAESSSNNNNSTASLTSTAHANVPLIDITGENTSGYYELHAVLTHIGRSSDSGHYMAWVRDNKDANVWWRFDDDKVTSVPTDEVLKLNGGGDWHMAYLCVYRERQLPVGY